jgi:hypothetical protein
MQRESPPPARNRQPSIGRPDGSPQPRTRAFRPNHPHRTGDPAGRPTGRTQPSHRTLPIARATLRVAPPATADPALQQSPNGRPSPPTEPAPPHERPFGSPQRRTQPSNRTLPIARATQRVAPAADPGLPPDHPARAGLPPAPAAAGPLPPDRIRGDIPSRCSQAGFRADNAIVIAPLPEPVFPPPQPQPDRRLRDPRLQLAQSRPYASGWRTGVRPRSLSGN